MTVTKLFACDRNSGFSSKSQVASFLTTTYSTGNTASNIHSPCSWMCYEKERASRDTNRVILVREHRGPDYKQSRFNEYSWDLDIAAPVSLTLVIYIKNQFLNWRMCQALKNMQYPEFLSFGRAHSSEQLSTHLCTREKIQLLQISKLCIKYG